MILYQKLNLYRKNEGNPYKKNIIESSQVLLVYFAKINISISEERLGTITECIGIQANNIIEHLG